jgi:hypothetical protein
MPTDDADRVDYTGCEPFAPGDDYDPMYEGYGDEPKCGGCFRGNGIGCRHCSPPDYEAKAYGFGIESFEDPALEEANAYANACYRMSGSMYRAMGSYWETLDARREVRDARWQANTRHSSRRLRHSEIIWVRLCENCETHGEAVRAYKKWAKRAATVRYRDESAPGVVTSQAA